MRLLWEIFTLIAAIGIILAVGRGFPTFGKVMASFLFNPVGLMLTIGMICVIVYVRRRKSAVSGSRRQPQDRR